MESPLVTIITPSLNQGRFIEQAIRSVLAQDYEPIEYLIYDAESADETGDVLARYKDRARVTIQKDDGQADAINRGLRVARGEVVAWLNADDLYLPGAIAGGVAFLRSHPSCAMVYGEASYIDATGQIIGRYPTAPVSHLREGCFVCQPATFMRRQAVATVGYLDPSLRFCLDYDLWLRLSSCFEVGYVARELARSRLHPRAKTVAHQLAFHREVVDMTYRLLGVTPLPWLYGYADLLLRERWHRTPKGPRAVAAAALTLLWMRRYHRRVTREDLRLLARARRGTTVPVTRAPSAARTPPLA